MGVISEEIRHTHRERDAAPDLRVFSQAEDAALDALARSRGRYARLVKPVIDRVVAAILLVIAAPVMLAIAIAVVLGVGRPIIFRQVRVGQGGELFTVLKFCTMTADRRREQRDVAGDRRISHKCDDDPRLRPVGRLLRRWSLDELPQLLNVVRGEMSLVGPRPELPTIVGTFEEWQHSRHLVKPGLTGFWQVYARGDGQLMHHRTELDIAYVGRIGLLTDLKVLLLTIPAIVGLKRGY